MCVLRLVAALGSGILLHHQRSSQSLERCVIKRTTAHNGGLVCGCACLRAWVRMRETYMCGWRCGNQTGCIWWRTQRCVCSMFAWELLAQNYKIAQQTQLRPALGHLNTCTVGCYKFLDFFEDSVLQRRRMLKQKLLQTEPKKSTISERDVAV